MFIDICVVFLLILAFIAGFQRGVLKVFSVVLSLLIACLVFAWLFPYYTEFFFASLSESYEAYYEVGTLILFLLLALCSFGIIRLLWRREDTERHLFMRKSLGGFTMVMLMVSTIVTLGGFFQQADLLQKSDLKKSRAMTLLEPMQTLGSKIYSKIADSRDRFREGHGSI